MGLAVPTGRIAGQQDPRVYLEESRYKFIYQGLLGGGKFIKTILCKDRHGSQVVVKVYVKRNRNLSLHEYEKKLVHLRQKVSIIDQPNIFPYQQFHDLENLGAAFLVRQYMPHNLYDRFNTRPFLMTIEKKWITYQLLRAISQCNDIGIRHGDIKSENILLTSWNWIFLSDFAFFKPCYLPEDDPAGYYYFFNSGGRRRCYIAPERFYSDYADLDAKTSSTLHEKRMLAAVKESAVSFDAKTSSTLHEKRKLAAAKKSFYGANNDSMQNIKLHKHALDMAASKLKRNASQKRKDRGESFSSIHHGPQDGILSEGMDIFSIGCVIAELFLDGNSPLFDLSKLLKYRTGGEESRRALAIALEKVNNHDVSTMIQSMLHHDTHKRYTAEEYLSRYTMDDNANGVFPNAFNTCLFPFMASMMLKENASPDMKILAICKNYKDLVENVVGVMDEEGDNFFQDRMNVHNILGRDSHLPEANEHNLRYEEEANIPKFQDKWWDLSDLERDIKNVINSNDEDDDGKDDDGGNDNNKNSTSLNVDLDNNNKNDNKKQNIKSKAHIFQLPYEGKQCRNESIVIIIQLLCSNIQHVNDCECRLTGLYLLQRLSLYATDEARLQRTIPYIIALLRDPLPSLRAAAIRALTQVLGSVENVPSSDTNIFPEYIFPGMTPLASETSKGVKLAFVESLAEVAIISKRFLDISHAERQRLTILKSNKSYNNRGAIMKGNDGENDCSTKSATASISMNANIVVDGSYDFELDRLRDAVGNIISSLVAATRRSALHPPSSRSKNGKSGDSTNSMIKQSLLRNLASLCNFFGSDYSNDKIFPWMISFMNERDDWQLRKTFFQSISVAAPYLPTMIPTMITFIEDAFADGHEIVVKEALDCLTSISRLKISFDQVKARPIEIQRVCTHTSPLLCHPSLTIRKCAVSYFAVVLSILSQVEIQVYIMPILRSFISNKEMKITLPDILINKEKEERTRSSLYSLLIQPISKINYYSLVTSDSPPEFHDKEDFLAKVGMSLADYNENMQEYVGKHIRAVWGHRHSYNRYIQRKSSLEKLRRNTLFQIEVQKDVENNSNEEDEVMKLEVAFNGPLLPSDKSIVNIQNVPQRTISIPDQRFIKPSDIPLVFSSRHAKRNRKKLTADVAVVDQIRTAYGVSVNHKRIGRRLKKQFQSLRIPKLPPYMGFLRDDDMEEFTSYCTDINGEIYKYKSVFNDRNITLNPKENNNSRGSNIKQFGTHGTASPTRQRCEKFKTLLAELNGEHTKGITSIAVPDDQSLFLTGSLDATIRAWRFENLFIDVKNRSSAVRKTIDDTAVSSMATYDNTKSFLYGTAGGNVEVLCVESAPFNQIRKYKTENEGAIKEVASLTGTVSSTILYATAGGVIRGEDLRMKQTAHTCVMHPGLGNISSFAITDTTSVPWMTVGTEDGYIALWDLRFNVMGKLWRHSSRSPIHKMSIPSSPFPEAPSADTPVVITAAGNNEVSVWDILSNTCLHVFRTLSVNTKPDDVMATPKLDEMSLNFANRSTWGEKNGYGNFLVQNQINVEKDSVKNKIFSTSSLLQGGLHTNTSSTGGARNKNNTDFVSSFIWTGFGLPGMLAQTKNLLLTTGTDGFIRSWDVAEDNASETFQRPCEIMYTDLYEESGEDIDTRIHLSQTVQARPSHFTQQSSKNSVTDDMIRGKHNVDMKFISRNGHYLLVGDDSGVVKVWKYDT